MRGGLDFSHANNERLFRVTRGLVRRILGGLEAPQNGRPAPDALAVVSHFAAAAIVAGPYLAAYQLRMRDRSTMRQVQDTYVGAGRPRRIAAFTDRRPRRALESGSLKLCLAHELADGVGLVAFGVGPTSHVGSGTRVFPPAARLRAKWLPGFDATVPPVLELADALAEGDFDAVYLDTLGPMALVGAMLGGLFNVPVIARFHRRAVARLLAGEWRTVGRRVLGFFYSQVTDVRVTDRESRETLLALGVPVERIAVVESERADHISQAIAVL